MKKIKLFALALCAMLSTNVMAESSGLFNITVAGGNATITSFANDVTAADVKNLVIPATLTNTGGDPYKVIAVTALTSNATLLKAIETLVIEDENVATIGNSAFAGATALTSVTIGKAVTTIGNSAFEGCTALTTVNLENAEALNSIGNYAFGGAKVVTYDFSKAKAMLVFNTTPFIASGAGALNNYTTKVVLHANTTAIGAAFAGMTILDDINISGTKLATVGANAFKGDVSLTALTFPETIETIGATADDKPFVGCVRLATLEIPAKALTQVGDGTNNLFGTDALDLNALKTLKITGDVAATCALKTKAFSTCTALKTVEIGKGKTVDPKLFEASFATVCDAAAVTLGEITGNDFGAAKFLAIAATKAATLTIEKISVALAKEIIDGKVATTVSGAITKGVKFDALGTAATSLTFGGNITAAFTAYTAANANLTSIDFGSVELFYDDNDTPDDLADDTYTIPTGFNGATQATALTITWKPADAKAVKFAAKDAFKAASEATPANRKVSLSVTQAVAALYEYAEANLYNVKTFGAEPDSENVELTPANGVEGATTYFAKFYAAAGYKIAKTNGTATVKVYEAYVDDKDATIYMLPMSAINGYFFIGAGNPVIVKSTSTDKITAETLAAADAANAGKSDNYDSAGNSKNQIKRTATAMTGASIMTDLTKTYYAMAKPEKYGLSWKTFKTSTQMPANTFYITTKESSASRLNVVWLDEDATAIQGFKAKVEAGQIYNLRGEKVNASYKGIVIKDGKKYIQK